MVVQSHGDDQKQRERFEEEFGHMCQLQPQNRVGHETHVVAILYGPKTHTDKQIAWEIASAHSLSMSGMCGVIAVFLPTFPVTGEGKPNTHYVHPQLRESINKGYTETFYWPPRSSYNLVAFEVAALEADEKRVQARSRFGWLKALKKRIFLA